MMTLATRADRALVRGVAIVLEIVDLWVFGLVAITTIGFLVLALAAGAVFVAGSWIYYLIHRAARWANPS